MPFAASQMRSLVALVCKVAWADGVVADEERAQVAALVARLGGASVTAEELDAWLTTGAPPPELTELPPALRELLIYEAMQLIQVDGDIADAELALVESLVNRVAEQHPAASIARVAVEKRRA